jgi:hypothetical protein
VPAWFASQTQQVTTATVFGRVQDAQGGVIPGATLVLLSETRGTRTAPVVTNATGDYVFPNVSADTYTIEVSMNGFKTAKRAGISVSPAIARRCRPSRLKSAARPKPLTSKPKRP